MTGGAIYYICEKNHMNILLAENLFPLHFTTLQEPHFYCDASLLEFGYRMFYVADNEE